MDAIGYLKYQFSGLHERSCMPLAGLTDEQINRLPPGKANKIGTVLLHALSGEDQFIQLFLQEKPLLWDSQNWSAKIGIPYPPGGPKGWDEAKACTLSLAAILEYQQAVYAATNAYIESLSPDDLDCIMPFFGYKLPLALILSMCVCHSAEHFGEISGLKGVMEMEGA